jgi:hypothetical protein
MTIFATGCAGLFGDKLDHIGYYGQKESYNFVTET